MEFLFNILGSFRYWSIQCTRTDTQYGQLKPHGNATEQKIRLFLFWDFFYFLVNIYSRAFQVNSFIIIGYRFCICRRFKELFAGH